MARIILICCMMFLMQMAYAIELSNPAVLFSPIQNTVQLTDVIEKTSNYYPTNAWFTNFLMNKNPASPSNTVNLFPYLARASKQGIELSYSNRYHYLDSADPENVIADYFQFENPVQFGALEPLKKYVLEDHGAAHVMLRWDGQASSSMHSPIVIGSPYFTMFYNNLTPVFTFGTTILSINDSSDFAELPVEKRYKIKTQLKNGQIQTWILFSENPIQLRLVHDGLNQSRLILSNRYQGWIRLALSEDTQTLTQVDMDVLDKYSEAIPLQLLETVGNVSEKQMEIIWHWKTLNNQPPLMLTLPHHRKILQNNNALPAVLYHSIKGDMIGEVGDNWRLLLNVPRLDFLESKQLTLRNKEMIKEALGKETQAVIKNDLPDDGPYRTGKRLQRIARLVLIADQIGEIEWRNSLLSVLKHALAERMQGNTKWRLHYDQTWGGIIPEIDDYGEMHYNDHHFCYGYWVFAVAVVGKFDSVWLSTPLTGTHVTPRQWIEILIRDYANPSDIDSYFPKQRYQDTYQGHSWASGLSVLEDGQNQESSSEAVNAYVSIALYAKIVGDDALLLWGKKLVASEMLSAQTYWQVTDEDKIYSDEFVRSNGVVGNLWQTKVEVYTYFNQMSRHNSGWGLQYAFGIQMLPYTSISEQLYSRTWMIQSAPLIKNLLRNKYGQIEPGWKWILIKGLNIILSPDERAYYFNLARQTDESEFDNGDSKSSTLYALS